MNLSQFADNGPEETSNTNYDDGYLDPKNMVKNKAIQWTTTAKGLYQSCASTSNHLPPGVYKYVNTGMGYAFERQVINIDELLIMPDSLCDKIMQEIQVFLDTASEFRKYNVLHRRGYLFFGPAGSGKTSLVNQIVNNVVKQNGIILICNNPSNLELGLKEIRSVEADRFIVCMLEDIDALIDIYGEREILALLDGESQINKVLNIATTNYPQKLDKRIVSRPRRFDRVIEIGFPSTELRRHFFKHKLKVENAELEQWVQATDGFSFAACTDLLISTKCLRNDFQASVKILKEMMASYLPPKK